MDRIVVLLLVVLSLVSLVLSHKTHSSTSNIGATELHNEENEFFSKFENIVEEYKFQDQPHISPSSSEKDKWITSGNLAHYTMLHATKAVYLPVTVRLIFVGFDGDGNQGINFDLPNLEAWFEHIEHTFHHTWVSLENRDQPPSAPKKSDHTRVEYTINVEVAKVCPLVTTIIEDAILQYIRPEDPDYHSATATTTLDSSDQNTNFYVDAFSFSHVLGSLVTHLGMENDAYTLFVLNPKRPFATGDATYGYRAGFSTKEIQQIFRNQSIKATIESLPKMKQPAQPKAVSSDSAPPAQGAPTGKRRTIQFSDFSEQSETWAQAWLDKSTGGLMVNPACNSEDESQNCVSEVWGSDVIEKIPILELATKMATAGTPWQNRYVKSIFNTGGYEQCLVDGWVSNERFAFLDLTAGPFEWGPIIGGEGVRSKDSIPKVPTRKEWRDSDIDEELTIPSVAVDMERYQSELAVLEVYKSRYCPEGSSAEERQNQGCDGVDENIASMQETISALQVQGVAAYKATVFSGGEYEGVNATHVNDDFMSQLGATISSTIRTLFVPPAAAISGSDDEKLHEYTNRVAFHVYVIANHNQYNPRDEQNFNYEDFRRELTKFALPKQEFTFTIKSIDMSADPVLAAAFGASLHSTVVPGITVDHSARDNIPEGTFEAAPQLYIDTASLQQQLLNIASGGSAKQKGEKEKGAKSDESTHVPIFLFSVGGNLPVFVDKYFQSVALSNMIVGVQSNFFEWESQLACNSKPVYVNLKNPLRSLLASTVQYVAGLVPTHITFSEAYNTGTQNWLWAGLGNSPLSILSSSGGPSASTFHFSNIHTDTAHRNFVVHSIVKAQRLLNMGVAALYAQRTTEHNLPILKHMHSTLALTNLSHYHTETHTAWRFASDSVAVFDWQAALRYSEQAVESAQMFYERATEIAELTELTECLNMTPTENVVESKWKLPAWTLPVSIAGDVLIILLWFVFRNRNTKLKIN